MEKTTELLVVFWCQGREVDDWIGATPPKEISPKEIYQTMKIRTLEANS